MHGNPSRYALVTPNRPVSVLAALASIQGAPDRIRLAWYAPANPGLAATVYRRSEGSEWAALGAVVADARGYLRYEDATVETGRRYGYRLGIADGDAEVFAGEAWAVAERLEFALEGARPNPAVGGELTVFFALPSGAPARLELLDIGGRRVARREVGPLGPGRHAVNLGGDRTIPPGIYLVRLSRTGETHVSRVAVIE